MDAAQAECAEADLIQSDIGGQGEISHEAKIAGNVDVLAIDQVTQVVDLEGGERTLENVASTKGGGIGQVDLTAGLTSEIVATIADQEGASVVARAVVGVDEECSAV